MANVNIIKEPINYQDTNPSYSYTGLYPYTDKSKLDSLPSASNILQKSSTTGLVKNDGMIDTNTYLTSVPTATSSALGLVKPDNSTITVDANGVISSSGGASPVKTRYTLSAANWSNSVDAQGYYTYTISNLNPALDITYPPNIYLTGADDSTFYTDTEATQYSYLAQCNLTTSTSITLYAKTKPDSNFYIFIEGLPA